MSAENATQECRYVCFNDTIQVILRYTVAVSGLLLAVSSLLLAVYC